MNSSPLGWAEIVHPYHPLRAQRFPVLKTRRVAGVDTLILRESTRGSFAVPREWTDWRDGSGQELLDVAAQAQMLDADSVLQLVALVELLRAPSKKGVAK